MYDCLEDETDALKKYCLLSLVDVTLSDPSLIANMKNGTYPIGNEYNLHSTQFSILTSHHTIVITEYPTIGSSEFVTLTMIEILPWWFWTKAPALAKL